MRKLFTLAAICIAFLSCGNSEELPEVLEPENEDYYNCENFFNSGDYSMHCSIDTTLPTITDEIIDGGGTVCRYIFPPLDENQVESGVQFTSLETSALAIVIFDNRSMQSETEAATDSLQFHTTTTIDGYEAFISEGNYANYAKTVTVRYKNVLVTTLVVYYKDWFPETPCNYETEELVWLMSEVLKNMD